MKNPMRFLLMLSLFNLGAVNAEQAPDGITKVIPEIRVLAASPVIMDAVKAQNAKKMSLDDIKKRDVAWQGVTGVDDFMKGLLNNAAAREMLNFEKTPVLLSGVLPDGQPGCKCGHDQQDIRLLAGG